MSSSALLLAAASAGMDGPAFEDASERLLGTLNQSLLGGGSGYSGVAFLDADGDGWLDLYFTDGPGFDNVLLLNDGTGHFVDATIAAGVGVGTGSRGALAADLDGDDDPDLVLTGDLRAPLRVLRNRGDGTFDDISDQSGLTGAMRNISAHAADIDGDGLADVYLTAGVLPQQSIPNTLWRNDGDATFTEVASTSGVATSEGACAATFTHFDLDDDAIDLVVANCGEDGADLPIEMYEGRGDGTFEDRYTTSHVWELGHWMGLAVADFDGDLLLDFFVTNSGIDRDQPHALYRNEGGGAWSEIASSAGVADWEFGWGTVAEDFDNDGWIDLYYAGRSQVGDHCASPGNLFRNNGDGTFAPPTRPLDLSNAWTSGVAAGDIDGDGFVDIVVTRTAVPAEGATGEAILLRNLGAENHWLTVRLRPAAIGARVVVGAAGRLQVREVQAGSSYQSTSSPWPTFGLGSATDASVCVHWPGGSEEAFGVVPADARIDLTQGEGTPADCEAAPHDAGARPPIVPSDGTCGCSTRTPPRAGVALLLALIGLRRRAA